MAWNSPSNIYRQLLPILSLTSHVSFLFPIFGSYSYHPHHCLEGQLEDSLLGGECREPPGDGGGIIGLSSWWNNRQLTWKHLLRKTSLKQMHMFPGWYDTWWLIPRIVSGLQPWLFQWDFCGGNVHVNNWGELTHLLSGMNHYDRYVPIVFPTSSNFLASMTWGRFYW